MKFSTLLKVNGCICLALYVVCDSFSTNWQEKLFSKNLGGIELIFGVSLFSTLLTGTSLAIQNDFAPAIEFVRTHDSACFHLVMLGIFSGESTNSNSFTQAQPISILYSIGYTQLLTDI